MRGEDEKQSAMFSYVTLERRVPQDHPLRAIRGMVDRALERMDADLDKLYAGGWAAGQLLRSGCCGRCW